MDKYLWQAEEHTEYMARGSYENEGDTASRYDAAVLARVAMDLAHVVVDLGKRIKDLEESNRRPDAMRGDLIGF